MKKVIVITEEDLQYRTAEVIGVAESLSAAEKFLDYYYDDTKTEELHTGLNDGCLQYSKVLIVEGWEGEYKVRVSLDWFTIHE